MEHEQAIRYLCLARKAGLLTIGEENCGLTIAAGKGKLLMLCSDSSANARKRADGFLYGHRALLMTVPWTKAELSQFTGTHGSMVCFTDLGLASRFASAMAETLPEWKETASLLDARSDKAQRRKAAPRKHTPPRVQGGCKNGN